MTLTYRFLSPAEDEAGEASLFYEARSIGLGSQFPDELEHTIQIICRHQEIGAPIRSERRKLSLRRFPFNVIYSAEENMILVVAAAHQSRRPGYWETRIS